MNGAADVDCAPAAGAITNAAAATAPAVPANVRAIRWITDMSRSPLEGPLCGTTEEARKSSPSVARTLHPCHEPRARRVQMRTARVNKWPGFGALRAAETRPAAEMGFVAWRGLAPPVGAMARLVQPGKIGVVGGEMLVIVYAAAGAGGPACRLGPAGVAGPACVAGPAGLGGSAGLAGFGRIAGLAAAGVRGDQFVEIGLPHALEPALSACVGQLIAAPHEEHDHHEREHERVAANPHHRAAPVHRSEEHTSELQSLRHLVCRLL